MKKTALITALLMTAPSLALAQAIPAYMPARPIILPSSPPMNGTPVYRPPVLSQPDNSWADRMQAEREASRQADIQRQMEADHIQEQRQMDSERRNNMFKSSAPLLFEEEE